MGDEMDLREHEIGMVDEIVSRVVAGLRYGQASQGRDVGTAAGGTLNLGGAVEFGGATAVTPDDALDIAAGAIEREVELTEALEGAQVTIRAMTERLGAVEGAAKALCAGVYDVVPVMRRFPGVSPRELTMLHTLGQLSDSLEGAMR